MIESCLAVVCGLLLLLLAGAAVPRSLCNRFTKSLTILVPSLVACLAILASLVLVGYLANDPQSAYHLTWFGESAAAFTIHFDSVAGLMLALVSFVGLVVAKYSVRYLDGDAAQGDYFRWIGVTIGAVSLLVLSGNLLMFFAAWVATSYGLHQLLMHYPERAGARRAAWTKFAISRVGDLFLLTAIALVYREFGTLDFAELFAAVEASSQQQATTSWSQAAIGWLLMLGAVTKSAQFPLHGWLPETLETPTPVSALMHAGVVNAGGYLVIRLSPLIAETASALVALTVIGSVTVAYAGVVMLTQSSIKKTLAYSTVAQMGFMMLQCGLGAFSAAMLHILAHSLYKAHAFLNSGSVLKDVRAMQTESAASPKVSWLTALLMLLATLVTVAAFAAGFQTVIDIATKPGAAALMTVFCLAIGTGVWEAMATGRLKLSMAGIAAALTLTILYAGSYAVVNHWVAAHVPKPPQGGHAAVATGVVLAIFACLFAIQAVLRSGRRTALTEAAYVHALNGFYLDAVWRRLIGSLALRR